MKAPDYFIYRGEATREISFPLGGIGSGSLGLAGNGSFIDWDMWNRPAKGSRNGFTHIAVKASRGGKTLAARVLQGDIQKDFMGSLGGGFGYGPGNTSMEGFPHFRDTVFQGTFPIAEMNFGGEEFPCALSLAAFNPLIPGATDDSSIPAAFFEITARSEAEESLDFTACFSVGNPFPVSENIPFHSEKISGIFLKNAGTDPSSPEYGDLSIATEGDAAIQCCWYRGGWNDGIETFWRNFTELPELPARRYPEPGNRDMASLAVTLPLAPGEEKKIRFVLSWNMPNRINDWHPCRDEEGRDISWKNFYARLYTDSRASAADGLYRFTSLYKKTASFRDVFYSQTIDPEILDAAASSLAVLKSPTVLRLEDGSFYGWEGSNEKTGSCEGSCTHVWNYAYALCYLFPDLERSLRENDYTYNFCDNGKMEFRMSLPQGREQNHFRACVDGQMGGIIKTYREWKISGDTEWLRKLWPRVKKSLAYAWEPTNEDRWDSDHDGFLEGRQHHTLDMELFSASSWLESMYLCALCAAGEMADALGDPDGEEYRALYSSGLEKSERELFNGEYYFQKIDLSNRNLIERFLPPEGETKLFWNDSRGLMKTYWQEEAGEIKYQIGEGCEIDQLLGEWHASLCGLKPIFDPARVDKALESIMKYNYQESFRNFYNPFRLFAVDDDRGTVMCAYPEQAKKPAIPVPYCQETMHGFEYALAGLLSQRGMQEEALKVVRGVRERYRGTRRNPWNEIECGNNYARSMAAFALPMILEGFSCDMTRGEICFAPRTEQDTYRGFLALGQSWGSVEFTYDGDKALQSFTVTLEDSRGAKITRLGLPIKGKVKITIDGHTTETKTTDGKLSLPAPVQRFLRVERTV